MNKLFFNMEVGLLVKSNILILGCLALATILGIFGQSITKYLYDHNAEIKSIYYLTALTCTSYILYLVSAISTYIASKKQMWGENRIHGYFLIIGVIGLLTSFWSLFVLVMSWG